MSNYTNLQNYCGSCTNSSKGNYGTYQSYLSEGFTNKRNIVVNPSVPSTSKPSSHKKKNTSHKKVKTVFHKTGVL